jgi:hypothetical protein
MKLTNPLALHIDGRQFPPFSDLGDIKLAAGLPLDRVARGLLGNQVIVVEKIEPPAPEAAAAPAPAPGKPART